MLDILQSLFKVCFFHQIRRVSTDIFLRGGYFKEGGYFRFSGQVLKIEAVIFRGSVTFDILWHSRF